MDMNIKFTVLVPVQTLAAISELLDIGEFLCGSNLLYNLSLHTYMLYIHLLCTVCPDKSKPNITLCRKLV
jgi:hypothetical protein